MKTDRSNSSIIGISNVSKVYRDGFQALKEINLDIQKGEIFALLGPNGAGKTTLINSICGIVNPTHGQILVDGHDNQKAYKKARELIGLVPQELTTDAFETVWATVNFSRGLFGRPKDHPLIEKILKQLSLWDKRNNRLMTLSGGMKRRVMIAKALSHGPRILFLDEPTAGVDVELRKSMWNQVRELRESGVTVILTTHYIEEAEQMADRIGVINHGELILVERKDRLMRKLGAKQLTLFLENKMESIPPELGDFQLKIIDDGMGLVLSYDAVENENPIAGFLHKIDRSGIAFRDLKTKQNSLEEIFVQLVENK